MEEKRNLLMRALLTYKPSKKEIEHYNTLTNQELEDLASTKFLSWCDSFRDAGCISYEDERTSTHEEN